MNNLHFTLLGALAWPVFHSPNAWWMAAIGAVSTLAICILVDVFFWVLRRMIVGGE